MLTAGKALLQNVFDLTSNLFNNKFMNLAFFSPTVSSCRRESSCGREILTESQWFFKNKAEDSQFRHVMKPVSNPQQKAGADTAEECESCCEASDRDMTS